MHELGYPCVQCAAVYLIYYILNVHLHQTGFLTLNTINILGWIMHCWGGWVGGGCQLVPGFYLFRCQ